MDRNRRQKILDATLKVILDRGLNGVTHRLVAKTAGVPLSATSYYFGTIEQMVDAAFVEAIDRDRERFQRRVERVRLNEDPIAGIVQLTNDMLDDRQTTVLSLELTIRSLRNPRLQPLARAWENAWTDVLTPYLGARKARLATAIMVAIAMRGMLDPDRMPPDEIEEIVRDTIGPLLAPS